MTVALALVLGPACGASPTEPSVSFRVLQPHTSIGPFTCETGVRVVRDAAEWASLSAGRFPEPPAIDFAAESVVLVSLGTRPTSGYSVEPLDVRRRGTALTIEAIEFTVGRCVALQVITCPGAVVVVPRTNGAVGVEWRAPRPAPGCD